MTNGSKTLRSSGTTNGAFMQNLLNELKQLLLQDERCVAEGQLLKNKVIELALAVDAGLIKLLLKNKSIKKHFFTDIDGVLVFDKIKFQHFVSNKEFLPDSYTAFKNKIGLANENDDYLSESREVVLAWPYKDCVLEGGQTKDDQKRDELFWNETLAPDEIDRLLAPKVFTDFKRYNSKGEHVLKGSEKIDISKENLIIRGNNLLVLHSLYEKYAGKVKLIYIDPPYNTGNDEFKYNDTFNHSTWLSFIRNRLIIGKLLLRMDGSIFISIDENELGYILVLCDEIFGEENRANIISIKRGSLTGHKSINPGAVNITEYVVCYCRNRSLWKPNRVFIKRERNERYNNFIINRDKSVSNWRFCSLLDAFAKHLNIPKAKLKKKLGDSFEEKIYDFVIKNADSVIQFAYPDPDKVSKEVKELIDKSKKNPSIIYYQKRNDDPDIYLYNGQRLLFYSERLMNIDGELVTGEPLSDFWDDVLPNDLHNEGGVKLKKGKKPEKLLQRIIELGSKKNELVFDFFLGSGTSACVSLKLDRKFIGVEQLDYENNDGVHRLINTIEGEQSGISKAVNWNGGGSFIYCELMEWNEAYNSQIKKAKTSRELIAIWEEMQSKAFISYKVDPKAMNDNIKDFKELSLADQKRFLIEVLDKNQLYVNYSEIDDKEYGVSETDKKLNQQFYDEA
jgi:adenine-specific DNA-methyltransferase